MLIDTWSDVLTSSFQRLWSAVIAFIPNVFIAIVIFILGWVIGLVLGQWVAKIIRSIQVDKALKSVGAEEVLSKAGFRLDSCAFIGGLVKWFVIVAFLVASFDVLGLTQVNEFLRNVVLLYLPNVIVAALILLLAAVIAEALKKVVVGSARAVGAHSAHFFGVVTKWAVWIFAILAALNQLGVGVAGDFYRALLAGVITMLSIAGGLAFGLGGKEAAARYIEKLREDVNSKH